METKELLAQLQANRKVRTGDEVEKFLEAIAEINDLQDYRNIPLLFTGFDDESEDFEMMYEIIHTAENYIDQVGMELYLQMLFQSLVPVSNHGRTWIRFMLQRILNSSTALVAAKLMVRTCEKETRDLMYVFLDEIYQENPVQFAETAPSLQHTLSEIEDFLKNEGRLDDEKKR